MCRGRSHPLTRITSAARSPTMTARRCGLRCSVRPSPGSLLGPRAQVHLYSLLHSLTKSQFDIPNPGGACSLISSSLHDLDALILCDALNRGVHANGGMEAKKGKIDPYNCCAGANAVMLAAMRLIGAKNATAELKQLSSATNASPRPPTPAAAVLPMLQSSPSGAKVRQVRMRAHFSGG